MKKVFSLLLCFILLLCNTISILADESDEIQIVFNNEPIVLDVSPQIVNDRTMVPVRAVCEAMGATVEWEANTKTVKIDKDKSVIELTIGVPKIEGDAGHKDLDVAPYIYNDRVLIPLRAIFELFEAKVEWKASEKEIHIVYDEKELFNKYNLCDLQLSDDSEILNMQYFHREKDHVFSAMIQLSSYDFNQLKELAEKHFCDLEVAPFEGRENEVISLLRLNEWGLIETIQDVNYISEDSIAVSDPSMRSIVSIRMLIREMDDGRYYAYVIQF